MTYRIAALVLAWLLAATPSMAGRAYQRSKDNTHQFAGIVLHGPQLGRLPDFHIDVFGGANWPNDTSLRIYERPMDLDLQGNGVLGGEIMASFTDDGAGPRHAVPPHGEAAKKLVGGWAGMVMEASVPKKTVRKTRRRTLRHGVHTDETTAILLGPSRGQTWDGLVGLVIAEHKVPVEERSFLVYSDRLRPEAPERWHGEVVGVAGLVASAWNETALLGLGLLGTWYGAIDRVVVRLGTVDEPGPVVIEVAGEEVPRAGDVGFGGVVETGVTPEQVAAMRAKGAYVTIRGSKVTLAAQLEEVPVTNEEPGGLDGRIWNLGTQRAGSTAKGKLRAVNLSCPGRRDFSVSVESGAERFLRITRRRKLRNIRPGRSKAARARLDLREMEPGTYNDGTVVIRCADCPPSCQPGPELVRVHLKVVGEP